MDVDECDGCKWMGVNPLESEEVCMLYGERPIGEIESCNADELTVEQEILVIEERRDN